MGGSWSLAGLELAGQGFTSLLSHLALTLSRLPLAGYTLARPCLSPGSQSRSLLRPHLSARAAQEALWLTPSLGFLLSMPWFPHLHSRVHTHVAQGGGGGGEGDGPRARRGPGRLPCLLLHRLPQAAPLPAAAGRQREHGAGGGGRPPGRLHSVHRQCRRCSGLPKPPPLSDQPCQLAPRSRQVFFSR